MRADCHMHTYFSGDSEAKPEDMVLSAIDKGLEAICFTDHEDIDYYCDDIEFVFDPERCGIWNAAASGRKGERIYRGTSI